MPSPVLTLNKALPLGATISRKVFLRQSPDGLTSLRMGKKKLQFTLDIDNEVKNEISASHFQKY